MDSTSRDYQNLEQFVLSSNRRKLLQIARDDEEKQTKDVTNDEISGILFGSNEHKYYHLLQIENEITSILIKQ